MSTGKQPWDADIEITLELVSKLIRSQFPGLRDFEIEELGKGWDNAAYLLSSPTERYVFRFPCRHVAAHLITNEARVLPKLGPRLPIPVPMPIFIGEPSSEYPHLFVGYRYLCGVSACGLNLTRSHRSQLARQIALFLSTLHSDQLIEEYPDLPDDSFVRADLYSRMKQIRLRVPKIASLLNDIDADFLLEACERLASQANPTIRRCWIHGDLYARHLLIDEDSLSEAAACELGICGVIDWGDVHIGDPALDLSIAFSYLPAEARPEFRKTYGPIDDNAWLQARFRALHYGVLLLDYGTSIGDYGLRNLGTLALTNALEDA